MALQVEISMAALASMSKIEAPQPKTKK